ncbi:MAG: hypothetical protein LBT42_05790 [Tannerella sp.]|jgi:hypothetical protein|nr:hypothetical protein [Tannerella sp.]
MKRTYLSLVICAILFAPALGAQEKQVVEGELFPTVIEEEPKSSISMNGIFSDFTFSWEKGKTRSTFNGIQFGFANISGMGDAKLSPWSVFASFHPLSISFVFKSHWSVGLSVGYGLDYYWFKKNTALTQVDGITQFVFSDEEQQYESGALTNLYLSAPLFIKYQTKIKNRLYHIQGGIDMIDYTYSSGASLKRRDLSGKHRESNIPLNYSTNGAYRFVLQMGLQDIGLYMYYQPVSMFEKNKGPNLHSWGIGLSAPL